MTKVLTSRFHLTGRACDIDVYMEHGGYQALPKALKEFKPDQVIEEVKKSALRGRGGGGVPTGMKWGFVPKESKAPQKLVWHPDESEPGTGKDRDLMRYDPHQMIEGMIIAAYALGARDNYIYIRGEYWHILEIMEKALAQAYKRGFLGENILGSGFDCNIYMHPGAGAYICGEETALLESLEGKRGHPPPKPAVPGRGRTVRRPDRGQQRRDAGRRAVDHPEGRRLVPPARDRKERGHEALHRQRTRQPSRQLRSPDGLSADVADQRRMRRHYRRSQVQSLHPGRLVSADPDRRRVRESYARL